MIAVTVRPTRPEEALHSVAPAAWNDMNVKVRHTLADLVVERDKRPVGFKAALDGTSYQLRRREHRLKKGGRKIGKELVVLSGAHQTVPGKDRTGIEKNNDSVILMYTVRVYVAGYDLTEHARGIAHSLHARPVD
jgi:hypothetical protein